VLCHGRPQVLRRMGFTILPDYGSGGANPGCRAGRVRRWPARRRLACARACAAVLGQTRPAGAAAAAGAAAGRHSGWPTGTIARPDMLFATTAAEAYQATSAVRMPM